MSKLILQEAGCFDCKLTWKGEKCREEMIAHTKQALHTGWVSAIDETLLPPPPAYDYGC